MEQRLIDYKPKYENVLITDLDYPRAATFTKFLAAIERWGGRIIESAIISDRTESVLICLKATKERK